VFEGMVMGVGTVILGFWDKGIVVSLSDVVLVEECCIYRCQGFC